MASVDSRVRERLAAMTPEDRAALSRAIEAMFVRAIGTLPPRPDERRRLPDRAWYDGRIRE